MFKKFITAFLTVVVIATLATAVAADEADHNGYIVKMDTTQIRLFGMPDELDGAKYYGDGLYVVDDYETALALSGEASYIEPNYVIKLFGSYNYTDVMSKNYAIGATNVKAMWDLGCYGDDIVVAVVDSGCNPHTYLNSSYVQGYNTLGSTTEEKADTTDSNVGHGTMVAGFVAARHGGKYAVGTAHHAKIMPIKVFSGETSSDVAAMYAGVKYAVDNGCDILNMSFGAPQNNITMREAINYAADRGVIIVAAVGNDGASTIQYPAGYDNVIGVGAVDSKNVKCDFSNYNSSVYVVAPGKTLYSTYYTGNQIGKGDGTSFACPIVAGIIADMLSIDPDLTIDEVKTILRATSTKIGTLSDTVERNNDYGYGLINAQAIAEYMLQDKDYFVSAIDTFTATPEVTVWKNPDAADTGVGIWTKDGGENPQLEMALDFSLNNAVTIHFTKGTYESLEFMYWKDLNNIMPLYDVKSYMAD